MSISTNINQTIEICNKCRGFGIHNPDLTKTDIRDIGANAVQCTLCNSTGRLLIITSTVRCPYNAPKMLLSHAMTVLKNALGYIKNEANELKV